MINVIYANKYFRLFIVAMLALIVSFANELKILNERWVLFLTGTIIVLVVMHDPSIEVGLIFILVALFIVIYNQQAKLYFISKTT